MINRIFLIVLIAASISNITYAQLDSKAKVILDRARQRYSDIDYFRIKFNYVLENKNNNTKDSFDGTIIIYGDKFYLKIKDQEIYNNGTTVWTYIKESNEVNISNFEPDENEVTPNKIYSMYEKGFKYELMEENVYVINGYYDKIRLTPENKNLSYHTVYVYIKRSNPNMSAIKKWQILEKNSNVYTFTVNEMTKYPKEVTNDADFFNFQKSKYPGVEVVDLR